MSSLATFSTTIFLRTQFFRLCKPISTISACSNNDVRNQLIKPPKARSKGVFSCCNIATFSFQLQANVKDGVNGTRNIMTSLAFDITLKLTRECGVNNAITRNICESTRGRMDLVQSRNKELVCILLCITGEFCRCLPSGC